MSPGSSYEMIMQDGHIIIMGVSGCGKSTVGRMLAKRLDRPFIEGDDFHPAENVAKMASGQALTNQDREAWIKTLCPAANEGPSSIIACSALNATVREWLGAGLHKPARYVWLEGLETLLAKRLAGRSGHFFDPSLLASQFAALDAPQDAITVSVDQAVETIMKEILLALDEE